MKTQLNEFLEINSKSCDNPQTLWETTKCFLRGTCIAFASKLKRERDKRLSEIEVEVRKLEKAQSEAFSEVNANALGALKGEYKSISIGKAEFILHRTKQRYYYDGDRPSRLLALRLKESESKAVINAIRTTNGEVVTDPTLINEVFRDFYSDLYTSECYADTEKCTSFLQKLALPSLDCSDSLRLEDPISLEELEAAVKTLQKGKSPGTDGLPPELYLAFWDQVGPLILGSINFAIEQGSFHRDQGSALITVLLKKGKDPLECSSYRPISLICADVKLYAKVLVSRMEKVIGKLINFDQTGFLKGRVAADNVRRLLHVIAAADTMPVDCCVLSLDTHKAFDRQEWNYLWLVMKRFGFGEKCISVIQTLYNHATASVLTGTCQSRTFPLHRGTRQGCPLSPLLFALSLEPLAQSIRESDTISPITIDRSQHYISLYADDCLLFISNIQTSLPHILKRFDTFREMAGFKINWTKSALLPLNVVAKNTNLTDDVPICTSFTYLIKIYPTLSKITQENFLSLKRKLTDDLKRWSTLYFSLQGRVTTVKMNVLPRINFLFFMIPLAPPPKFIMEMHTLLSHFIWGGKRARIKLTTLQRSKLNGGLAVPNLNFYYYAFQIRPLHVWRDRESEVPWRALEAARVKPHRLEDLLYTGRGSRNINLRYGSIITNSIAVWQRVEQMTGKIC